MYGAGITFAEKQASEAIALAFEGKLFPSLSR